MSTFQGLEIARKALFAQQNALYTTGHNIANVNTEGYSRQRVNFEAATPFPVASRVQPQIPGQLGTGVNVESVQRIRDQFLDAQYRTEHSRLGYWETKQEALNRMENLLNEPSESGLSNRLDLFWQSLEVLSSHPEDTGARSVVAQRGLALAETFNYFSQSLGSIQEDLKNQILISVDDDISNGNVTSDINVLLKNIGDLNQKIQEVEPHGFLPNDLYDQRDRLIDQLSNYMNIRVQHHKSSESKLASSIAEGVVTIEVLQSNGQPFADKIYLVDESDFHTPNYLQVDIAADENAVSGITIDGNEVLSDILQSDGALSALIESFGYMDGNEVKGDYPEMLAELNKMAAAFASAFNTQHESGNDLNGASGLAFFVPNDGTSQITARNLTVNENILADSNLVAAAEPGLGELNGNNALKLATVLDNDLADLEGASTREFYISLIGEMGVKGQEAQTMLASTEILQAQIDHSRMSVSAVSLDEEISNLIKFQHAYNAAARNMTAIDEMIDRIINQMGLVGR